MPLVRIGGFGDRLGRGSGRVIGHTIYRAIDGASVQRECLRRQSVERRHATMSNDA
jgi:hypothetical protein